MSARSVDPEQALRRGRFGEAQLGFLERLRDAPYDDGALLGLGRAFLGAGATKHAFGCFEKLVSRSPEHALAWRWLGITRHGLGRTEGAIEALERCATLAPDDPETHVLLGGVHLASERVDEAERAYRRATALAPHDARAWLGLGSCLVTLGLADEAREAFERGLAVEPGSLALRWAHYAATPLIHRDEEELAEESRRAQRASRDLAHEIDGASRTKLASALGAVQDNFRAHYRGEDVTALQRTHGRLVHRVASAAMPELSTPLTPRAHGGRLRVGFVSSCFRSHTVLELFERWMTELDPERFEVFVYHLGHLVDARTVALTRAVEHFHHEPREVRALGARVRDDELDVVVFPELGMDRRVLSLAATRLAPVQVTTCGHPVTTGLPTVDYFLSGELVEPSDGDDHYTERLVRLPGLGLAPRLPPLAPVLAPEERGEVRAALGLPADGPLLLACQSLFKYLPRHDALLVRIAQSVPNATIVMLAHPIATVTERFVRRLDAAFAAVGRARADHVRVLPRQSHEAYLQLHRAADLFLDSFDFSAGRSGFEAIATGLVPVSSPGRFARGRYLAGALCGLGMDELVAKDAEEYVEIVVDLCRDPARREALSKSLLHRAPRLFEGSAVLDAFARFLEDVGRPSASSAAATR